MKKFRKLALVLLLAVAMILPNALPVNGIVAVAEAATIKISSSKLTLEVGKTKTLTIKGSTKKATWKTSKKAVATVSSKGKVTAKAVGTTTITATVSSKKYTCKVTVKAAPNKYLKDAPFTAIETKIGDISVVIPKDYKFTSEEVLVEGEVSGNYTANLAPATSQGSYINIVMGTTGEEFTDYAELKAECSASYNEAMLQASYGATAKVSNLVTSDVTTDLGTAFKVKCTVTVTGIPVSLNMYFYEINNYAFMITSIDVEGFNLEAVADHLLQSITVTK